MDDAGARVLLVDDHPVVRQGLSGLLRDEGFRVVGAAATAHEALDTLARSEAEIVVLDLTLDGESGLELLGAVRDRFPGVVTVVYSVHEDGNRVRRAFEAGARGFVTKREDPEVVVQCLREVRSGERFASPRAARAMADAVAQGPARSPEKVLSPQELTVYALVGQGYGSREIAERLGLSVRTVDTYYGRIVLKLNVAGRRELRLDATEWARHNAGG